MRFSKYILTLLFFACVITAQAQNNLFTLQRCVDTAIKNNLNVKQTALAAQQDKINLTQAKDNLLPSITGGASRTISQGRGINPVTNTYVNQNLTSDNYNLSGYLTIFNGLVLQNSIKQASLAYQAGQMDYQSAKDQVTLNIISNYLSILEAQEQLASTQSQLEVAKQTVDRSEILEKEGANKSTVDLYTFRGAYAGSQVAVVSAQNSLDAAKLNLFQLMNIPYDRNAVFPDLNASNVKGNYGIATPDSVYDTALKQLAVIKAATLRRESAEKAVKVSKGQLLPTLSLNGNLGTNFSSAGQREVFIDSTVVNTGLYTNAPGGGKQPVFSTQANYASQNISYIDQFKNNYGTSASLSLNIPIFTNHIKKNAVALAKINLEIERNTEDNTKIQLRQSIETAFYNMTAAYNKYQALTNQVTAYTESFRISKIQYESGILTSVDFLVAKNNLDGADLNLISARYDYFIYSKILDYYEGKLSF